MAYKTFADALYALGFTTAEFWPQNADIRKKSDAQRCPFNPAARSPDKRYGPGASTAKGWPDGYPHGANLSLVEQVVRDPSNPLDLADHETFSVMSHKQNREDLNFLPGAYRWFVEKANTLGGSGGGQGQGGGQGPGDVPPTPAPNPTADLAPRVQSLEERVADLEKRLSA